MIGRDEFGPLIPHKGSMCLLRTVEEWDDASIRCSTDSHRDTANPLRRDGSLAAVHLVEYAAQAVAIHGGLSDRARGIPPGRGGRLVAVREAEFTVDRIDDIDGPLTIRAKRLVATDAGWLYAFEVEGDGRCLTRGRVGIMPGPPPQS